MTDDRAEFWNPRIRFGKWPELDGTVNLLVAAYGLSEVKRSVKRFDGRGRKANPDDVAMRVFVGRLIAAQYAGAGQKFSKRQIKKMWAATVPEGPAKNQRSAAEQKAQRVLDDSDLLGVTFALNELWGVMTDSEGRNLLRKIAANSKIGLSPTTRNIARLLAQADAAELRERPPSRGLLPDEPGLPRLKPMLSGLALELVSLAFPRGHLVAQKSA